MRDLESEYRVVEMLHAIKIFIEAESKLTEEDMKLLEAVSDYMMKGEEA